jgi:hypothetical protein
MSGKKLTSILLSVWHHMILKHATLLCFACLSLIAVTEPATGEPAKEAVPVLSESERAAITAFKAALQKLNSENQAEEAKVVASGKPVTIAFMGDVAKRMKAIETKGLPTDLQKGWTDLAKSVQDAFDLMDAQIVGALPMDQAIEVIEKKRANEPEFDKQFTALRTFGKNCKLAASELGKKYDVPEINGQNPKK